MKIIVFGATGGTGFQVVQQALNKGFEVTAFVRNPAKMNLANHALRIVQGDVLQPGSVEAVIEGHDAVVCCIGSPVNKTGQLRSEGTKNILHAMMKRDVKRLVCQASLGYADSSEILGNTGFVFKNIIAPFLLKKTFADHQLQEAYIKETDLNWTIIRPGSLTNGKHTGTYKQGFKYSDRSVKVKISRADTADFILKQLQGNDSDKLTIGVSY
jgi:putative NADH-flavin reductase